MMERIALYNDSFQNWKSHDILKAQLILTDIPYQLGDSAYGSNPMWYNGGDNDNGESKFAHKAFFDTDSKAGFRIAEFFHFCSSLLIKEPKETGKAPCMILFCAFEQQFELIQEAKKYGFNHYINLVFRKNFSAQVLKANMRVVGNCEYGLIFYRDKLPKFNNDGKMVFNCMDWIKDIITPKVHETQKPVPVLENLIRIFTDVDDVVIDCCAGSGTTLLAAKNLGRKSYGFELKKQYVKDFYEKILPCSQPDIFAEQVILEKKIQQLTFTGEIKNDK
jgi:site-specific DNA-methyltransferase (adenine-specific)